MCPPYNNAFAHLNLFSFSTLCFFMKLQALLTGDVGLGECSDGIVDLDFVADSGHGRGALRWLVTYWRNFLLGNFNPN